MNEDAVGIQVDSLNIYENGHHLLQDISVEFPTGQLTALIGPSGSGKTTLLRTLGLRPPSRKNGDSGIISLLSDGHAIQISGKTHQVLLDQIAYVPQQDLFPESSTVGEIINDALAFSGESIPPSQIITSVGFSEGFLTKRILKLSGGEKRRLTLARALCSAPKILLLDEPTSGLDIPAAHEIITLLRTLCDEQKLTIITTSHQPETLTICDRVLVLAKGGQLKADHSEPAKIISQHQEAELFNTATPPQDLNTYPTREPETTPDKSWHPRHFFTVFQRNARQALRDASAFRVSILLPIALAFVIIFSQSLHGENSPRFINFFLTIGALWIGMSLTIRDIVTERHLYAIDELNGLGKFSYFHAKAAFAGFMVAISTILLCAAAWTFVTLFKIEPNAIPESSWFDSRDFISHLLILGLVCFSGAMIGLLLSTLAKTERSAISLMPIVLLPHVLFSKYATGYAAEAVSTTLTHPFQSLSIQGLDTSQLTALETGNFWIGLTTSTRHGSAAFDNLGSSRFHFTDLFNLDTASLLFLIAAQACLALIAFSYSANTAIRRIK